MTFHSFHLSAKVRTPVVRWLCVLSALVLVGMPAFSQKRPVDTSGFAPRRRAVKAAADLPSGFFPGTIQYFAGPVTASNSFQNGLLPTEVQIGGETVTDSQGNVYLADGPGLYIVYAGNQIPAALANVTTNANPSVTPEAGLIYQVAGPETVGNQSGSACAATGCEGMPLNVVSLVNVSALTIDSQDNIYYADGQETPSTADVVRRIDAATSIVTTVAGQWGVASSSSDIGDGGPGTGATLNIPTDVKLDSYGNLYIDDNFNDVVRVVYLGSQLPPLLSAEGVTVGSGQKGYIYTVAGMVDDFCTTLGGCGDGTSATTSAGLGYEFSIALDAAGNLYIADAFGSGGPYIRIVYAGGAAPAILTQSLAATAAGAPPAAGYIYPVTGYAVTDYGPCTATPCGDGGAAANAVFGDSNLYITADAADNLYVADLAAYAVRKIDTAGYVSTIAGIDDPNQTVPASLPPAGGPAVGTFIGAPAQISFDSQNNLYIEGSIIWKVAPLLAQTINFPSFEPSTVAYGASPITLSATASSGLPVAYSVASTPGGIAYLSGTELVITGAGSVTVTANQPGNDAYTAASAVAQTLTVAPAPLTVTANPASRTQGTPNPAFTTTITGFVNGDTATTAGIYSGSPAFSTTATTNSPVGTYPIVPSIGSLQSANYTFPAANFIDGTLIVTGTSPQTINFPPFSPSTVSYGQAPIFLSATATSGSPISFLLISGPGRLSGQNDSTLTITGAGAINVEAIQEGNNQYKAAAPVKQTLIVTPAQLTVSGPGVTLPYGTTVNTASFPPPTITGFVGTDTEASILTGSVQYTTASGTPNPGTYPITVGIGTLTLLPGAASNYQIGKFVNGTLTVNASPQTITFPPIAGGQTYGNFVNLAAATSSNLPVTFTVTGPAIFYNGNNSILELNGIGTVTVTATQPGNSTYAAAPPLSQSFQVGQAPLNITANNVVREQGAPNPNLTYTIGCTNPVPGCFVLTDSDVPGVITGIPSVTTPADPSSPPGTYPIVLSQGTLAAPNYYFVFTNGTLTVNPPGSYNISANPSSFTIPAGQSGQTTITITPQNNYQGTVTVSCSQVPANVSCLVSPSTYTFPGSQYSTGAENPAQGTVTINAASGVIVGALSGPVSTIRSASLLIPGILGASFLALARRRACKRFAIWQLCAFFALSVSGLSLASCGGKGGFQAASPGTISVMINGSGTTPAGSATVSASTPLTVIIQ